MGNSIWKTDNLQEADTRKRVLFYAGGSSFPYLGWHYPNKGFGTWDYKDVQKWAYLSDVLAQADKAERLQKIAERQNDILQDHFATLGYSIGKEVMDMYDEINN